MMYDDDPDPYYRLDRGHRPRTRRRRSSPSLIDALDDEYSHHRSIERRQTNWPPPSTHYYHDDYYSAPRPTRINLDDDPWLAPGRYGQQTQARPWTATPSPSAFRGKRASASVASRQRQRQHDPHSPPARHLDRHQPAARDLERYQPPDRHLNRHQSAARDLERCQPPAQDLERRPAPSRYVDDGLFEKEAHTSESDAFSVFAHIDTESDSGSSDNRDNFDDDDNDDDNDNDHDRYSDVESAHRDPEPKRAPKSRPPKKADKGKRKSKKVVVAPAPEPTAGSESSFTMGSSEASVEIVARPPPGPEVDATDAAAVSALLWAVDLLDRFVLGLTIVLALVVVAALVGAVLAARPTLYVVSGVYAILWVLMHRETRILLTQVHSVHNLHAAMDAVQLAAADVVTVAHRTIVTSAGKLKSIVQVSAGGSIIFAILVVGLAVWIKDWTAAGLVAVIGALSAAVAALAPMQYSATLIAADRIIAEAR